MNTISTSLKTLVVFLVAVLLGGVVYAWAPPTAAPTGGNAFAPLNTSSLAQTKIGDLTVRALTVNTGAVFGGSIKIGNEAVPVPCSSTRTGSIRYNSTINNVEICNGTEWRALYTSVNSNSSGNGSITCNADKCVATCASAPTAPVTLGRNETKFCTKTGTATSNVWGTSGGYLNASISKKNFGWVATPVNYSVICDFFERASWVYMRNCRDNYGTGMPSAINLYTVYVDPYSGTSCVPTYRNYTTGTTHAEADFTNINCTSSGNATALVYTNSTCTGPTTRMYCFEEMNTNNTKYQVKNNVPLNFGTFPENWTSVDTNF